MGIDRRSFLSGGASGLVLTGMPTSWSQAATLGAAHQDVGERLEQHPSVQVLNPRERVPVSWIIDDSTCLVNLNRFAMPQFDAAFQGKNSSFHKPWKEWPIEIPDAFVRKFADWCNEHGVKGKYSVVPYPACVGRLDRMVPGWSRSELESSLRLVREQLMPNWDIHPEMVTHTRVIDLETGHPYPDESIRFMENWEWSVGRSADELTAYFNYALQILKNVGMPCEGVTTPGGFCNRSRPQLARATAESLREIFQVEIPHYFRDLFDQGDQSVAPLVQNARDLRSDDPRCVVHTIGCTGDWTGGWDCVQPDGADRFITADGSSGRLVDVIARREPALMVCHWTGIYWNGEELGFRVLQEVVQRLHRRYDNLVWMKLSEVARYWAARTLTEIRRVDSSVALYAPYACPDFTLRWQQPRVEQLKLMMDGRHAIELQPVQERSRLQAGKWYQDGDQVVACFDLPKKHSLLSVFPT